jgi:hypothetical protein
MKLTQADIEGEDFATINAPDRFRGALSAEDAVLSHTLPIMVRYDYIDLGKTPYHFSQKFHEKDTRAYFERMKSISSRSINDILNGDSRELHFHRSEVRGNLRKAFRALLPGAMADGQIVYHFALYTDHDAQANRAKDVRSPRIYFMLGNYGHIYVLFFDPYHELNPTTGL